MTDVTIEELKQKLKEVKAGLKLLEDHHEELLKLRRMDFDEALAYAKELIGQEEEVERIRSLEGEINSRFSLLWVIGLLIIGYLLLVVVL